MEGVEDRSCYFEHALVYVDKDGEVHTFIYGGAPGTLSAKVYEGNSKESWSDLWKIYISPKYGKPLAALNSEELKEEETSKDDKSEFTQFIKWLND
jgi:inosine/xanthosine triphosphate pyrophosphatase family protein